MVFDGQALTELMACLAEHASSFVTFAAQGAWSRTGIVSNKSKVEGKPTWRFSARYVGPIHKFGLGCPSFHSRLQDDLATRILCPLKSCPGVAFSPVVAPLTTDIPNVFEHRVRRSCSLACWHSLAVRSLPSMSQDVPQCWFWYQCLESTYLTPLCQALHVDYCPANWALELKQNKTRTALVGSLGAGFPNATNLRTGIEQTPGRPQW